MPFRSPLGERVSSTGYKSNNEGQGTPLPFSFSRLLKSGLSLHKGLSFRPTSACLPPTT